MCGNNCMHRGSKLASLLKTGISSEEELPSTVCARSLEKDLSMLGDQLYSIDGNESSLKVFVHGDMLFYKGSLIYTRYLKTEGSTLYKWYDKLTVSKSDLVHIFTDLLSSNITGETNG